jgi:hypothetical protein
MHNFKGSLQSRSNRETPLAVNLQFDGDRVRMWSDRHRIGSWNAAEVRIERESIFRFLLSIDDEQYTFSPDDPSGFATSVDVEIDLTSADRPRFGLAARIRQAADTG